MILIDWLVFSILLVLLHSLPEDLHPPASHGSEEAGPQVPGRVERVAAVQPHGDADGHDDQADGQRLHAFGGTDVPAIHDGQDAEDQHACPHHLWEEKVKRSAIMS